jgi:hypothetical protein
MTLKQYPGLVRIIGTWAQDAEITELRVQADADQLTVTMVHGQYGSDVRIPASAEQQIHLDDQAAEIVRTLHTMQANLSDWSRGLNLPGKLPRKNLGIKVFPERN